MAGEGVHSLAYRSIDAVENIEIPKTTTINIDLTPPEAVMYTLDGLYIPNGWYGSPVTIELTGEDALSGLEHYEMNQNGQGWH